MRGQVRARRTAAANDTALTLARDDDANGAWIGELKQTLGIRQLAGACQARTAPAGACPAASPGRSPA